MILFGLAGAAQAQSFFSSGPGGLCVDVKGGAIASLTPIQLWTCHGGAPQQFRFNAKAGKVQSVARPDLCVETISRPGDPNPHLVLQPCNLSAERWIYDSARKHVRARIGNVDRCWDVPNGNTDAKRFRAGQILIVYPCHGQINQQFVLAAAKQQRAAPLPPAKPSSAQAKQIQAHPFAFAKAGIWNLSRISDNPSGNGTIACVAQNDGRDSRDLRFATDGKDAIIEYRDGTDLRTYPPQINVQITFGTNGPPRNYAASISFDDGSTPWIRILERANADVGLERASQIAFRSPRGLTVIAVPDAGKLWPQFTRCLQTIAGVSAAPAQAASTAGSAPADMIRGLYRSGSKALADKGSRTRFFSPALLQSMAAQDRKCAGAQGPCGIDFDLLTGAQDLVKFGDLRVTEVARQQDRATVRVNYRNTAFKPSPAETVTFELQQVAGGWRIADIRYQDFTLTSQFKP